MIYIMYRRYLMGCKVRQRFFSKMPINFSIGDIVLSLNAILSLSLISFFLNIFYIAVKIKSSALFKRSVFPSQLFQPKQNGFSVW